MKKQNLIFITLLLPLHLLIAQSFTGNSLLLYLNVGIEALNTEYTYKIKNTGIDTLIKDKAANSNYFL